MSGVGQKSGVDFRLSCSRYIGLGANLEVDVRAISQGGSSIQVSVDVLAWVPIPEVEALVASQGGSSLQ